MNKYLFGLITATLFTPAHADQPKVYTHDSVVFNRTFADWSAAWRQWADSMPAKKHPLFDTASCSEGQSGPVWFLGGKFCASNPGSVCDNTAATRNCVVPEGVVLYFPVLNSGCLDAEAANNPNYCSGAGPVITQIRKTIAEAIDQATGLQVTVDGDSVNGNLLKNFRVQSTVYTSLLPDGNLYQEIGEPEIVKGTYVGVDDGIYVMLKPLSKGTHTLNFKGSFPPSFNFHLNVTYHLTVH